MPFISRIFQVSILALLLMGSLSLADGVQRAYADPIVSTDARDETQGLVIMSFNIRHGLYDGANGWELRKESVAEAVRRVNPLVLATQEGDKRMLADLQERLPEYDWIGIGREGGMDSFFNAIFYRPATLQVVSAGHFWLSDHPNRPGSKFTSAAMALPTTWVRFRFRDDGREFLIYNNHLDAKSQEAREKSATLIRDHAYQQRYYHRIPTVIVGDFNADPRNPVLETLRIDPDGERWLSDAADWKRMRGEGVGATFHGFRGVVSGTPIDHILVTKEWTVHEFGVFNERVDGRFPSDHYPVWARLSFIW